MRLFLVKMGVVTINRDKATDLSQLALFTLVIAVYNETQCKL